MPLAPRTALYALLLLPACQQLTVSHTAGERLLVRVGDREVVGWQYGPEWAIPHWFPLKTPSGRDLLVQQSEPYPHHRAMWIADKVQLGDGPVVDFYHGLPKEAEPRIRTQAASVLSWPNERGMLVRSQQQWLANGTLFLDDDRFLYVRPLDEGEALISVQWTLRASYGPVTFHSDWIHYAWPYLRLDPKFSAKGGAVIVDDQGRQGVDAIHGQYAKWVDCSATIDGVTEGIAIFQTEDGAEHKWLVRDYGCIGPRRPDAQSGTKFTLPKGEELRGQVWIYVHRGDAVTGRVAERYRETVRPGPRQ